MEIISEGLDQLLTRAWDWIWNVSWYWIFAGIGLAVQWHIKRDFKKVLTDIAIVIVLSVIWGNLNLIGADDSVAVMFVILVVVYIFYGFLEMCAEYSGTTGSMLFFIKGILVSMLSFQSFGGTIFGAILTCGLATLAYKYWIVVERKTDLCEIILLCGEAVLFSYCESKHNIYGFGIVLFVFYQETAIFLLNWAVTTILPSLFGETEK